MNRFRAESTKFATLKPLWILPVVAVVLTWVLTYVTGMSDVKLTGGDFEEAFNDPSVAFAAGEVVPLEYMGFEMMNFPLLIAIALGAIFAGSEYSGGMVRSSLIADPHRVALFATKATLLASVVAVTAFLSMAVGTALRHLALGEYGLGPLAFTPIMWRNVLGVVLICTMASLLAYALGIIARNAIVPLILMIPLSVGLGDFLLTLWEPAKFLPPAAGASLYSVVGDSNLDPVLAAIVTAAWGLGVTLISGILFTRRDA